MTTGRSSTRPTRPGWPVIAAFVAMALAPPMARAQSTTYAVGPGDVLQIMIYVAGEKRDDYSLTVAPTGAITAPLIGDLKVAGLTAPDIARRMKTALGRDYYVNPQVLVTVSQYGGKVYVLGEVHRPGIYPMGDGVTLLTICETAGGLTDFAAPRHVKLTRLQNGRPVRIDIDLVRIRQGKAPDVPLANGDRIEVAQRWF
jgi:polysaccharide export outer membrane protein